MESFPNYIGVFCKAAFNISGNAEDFSKKY
nr:MAG TPA: hypothetical protein [Caudoviricetes sp.]